MKSIRGYLALLAVCAFLGCDSNPTGPTAGKTTPAAAGGGDAGVSAPKSDGAGKGKTKAAGVTPSSAN